MTMGWLSLATRILPKVWRAGTKATSSLWRGGSAVLGTSGKVLSVAEITEEIGNHVDART